MVILSLTITYLLFWGQITWLFCSQIRLRETILEELHPMHLIASNKTCLIYMSPDLDDKSLDLEPELETKIE